MKPNFGLARNVGCSEVERQGGKDED
jgi:hypothetical protein